MTKTKYINKHISFDIKSRKTIVQGLVLGYSDTWTFAINNVVDYVCDGFLLVYKPSIKKHKHGSDNKWTEKILLLKTKQTKVPKINLTDAFSVFHSLKELNKVISVSNKKGDIVWIGRIIEVAANSIIIKTLTTKAKWAEKKTILYKDMTVIDFDTDYINSLLLIADK